MGSLVHNPMVATAALPLALGVALGALTEIAAKRWVSVVWAAWGVAVVYLAWAYFGLPSFPPVAASQKLVYLVYAGVPVGWLAGAFASANVRAGLIAAALLAAFAALGWRRLAAGPLDLRMIVAAIVAILVAAGAAGLIANTPGSAPPERAFLAPAAVIALAFAGAIVSVLGASIVAGQFQGAIAALVGGFCLASYLIMLAGRRAAVGWSAGAEFGVVFAAGCAFLQTALFAPDANLVALLLSPLALTAAALIEGRPLPLGPWPLRPLTAGLMIAIPAALAIAIAIAWAAEGAALGFS